MSHGNTPESRQPHPPHGEIPTHVISLRDERAAAPDQISTLAVLAMLVALLGTTCLPLFTVASIMVAGQAQQATAQPETQDDPLAMTTRPATQPATLPEIPVVSLAMVLVFFVIAVLGIVGGFGTLLRRRWGRRLLMTYAVLVLIYLVGAVGLRLHFGIEGMTQTAPTPSALSLNFTCVFAVLLLVALLMIVILRYLSQPHIAARFR